MSWNRDSAALAVMTFFNKLDIRSMYIFNLDYQDYRVYELYCLKRLVEWIEKRYDVKVKPENNNNTNFLGSAGTINRENYLYLSASDKLGNKLLEIHTNINVLTLGANNCNQMNDLSFASEIDIVVIDPDQEDESMLEPANLFIGLECKLRKRGNLQKKVINEVVGIRNETSFRIHTKVVSRIDFMLRHVRKKSNKRYVSVCPRSEYWLVQIGKEAERFRERLAQSNVKLKIWRPKPPKVNYIWRQKRKLSGQKLSDKLFRDFIGKVYSYRDYW